MHRIPENSTTLQKCVTSVVKLPTLSISQLGKLYFTANELERMTTKVNQEGMGQIEFNEFLQMMARKMSDGQSEEDLKEAFRLVDIMSSEYVFLFISIFLSEFTYISTHSST